MKYSVITFGCRVNQADSLGVEEGFRAHGAVATDADEADIVVVNTCSVTASADQAARQTIRRIARINPAAKIVVTGCYATRRPDEVVDLPGVMRVVPNDDKPELISSRASGFSRPDLDNGAIALATATGVAAPCSSPASPAGPRLRCGCRPDAPSSARTASSPPRAAGREACRLKMCSRKSRA